MNEVATNLVTVGGASPNTALSVSADLRPDGKPKLPVGRKAQVLLDLMGLAAICEWIVNGDRQSDIAAKLSLSQSDVGAWLMNHPNRDLYRAAQEASAEALVDKAHGIMEVLADDEKVSNAHVALAKARAEAYFKQAAMRSVRHRERQPEDNGPSVVVAPTFVISPIAASEGRPIGVTIDQVKETGNG